MKQTTLLLAALAATVLILGGCFRKHIESSPPARQPAEITTPAPGIIEETHVVGADKPEEPLTEPIEEVYEVDGARQAGTDTTAPALVGENDLAEEPMPDPDQLRREAEAAAEENRKLQTAPPAAAETGVEQPMAEQPMTEQPAVEQPMAEQPMAAEPAQAAAETPVVEAPAAETPAVETPAAEMPVVETVKETPAITDPEDEVVGAVDLPGVPAPTTAAPTAAAPAVAAGGPYYVQVGAFGELDNANKVLSRLLRDGYKDSVLIKTDEGLYRVQAGSFPDETAAGEALDALRADFPKGFVLKKP